MIDDGLPQAGRGRAGGRRHDRRRWRTSCRPTASPSNTYFVFSSDNGYHMGEYRLLPGKQTAFDTDIHVPLIVAGPGVAGRARRPPVRREHRPRADLRVARPARPLGRRSTGAAWCRCWHGQHPPVAQAVLVEHHGPDDTPADPDRADPAGGDPPCYEAIRTATAPTSATPTASASTTTPCTIRLN